MSPSRPKLTTSIVVTTRYPKISQGSRLAFARLNRVDPDPAEDIRQRDQHDRGIDRRQQGAQCGVGQRRHL
jgi:hypothetical protein